MLHLAVSVKPDIKVLWIDTGYLPPETYRFAAALTRRLRLNLHVEQSDVTPARMEALHGKLWERRGDEGEAGLGAEHAAAAGAGGDGEGGGESASGARLYGLLRKVSRAPPRHTAPPPARRRRGRSSGPGLPLALSLFPPLLRSRR